jgi:hypothetical protein
MPRARRFATNDITRDVTGRIVRAFMVVLGLIVVLAGILIAPLPGPMGLPVVVVGLMIVLRNSFKARRQFVRFQRAHPRMLSPVRRLLRREPEFVKVFWQQILRLERLVAPRRFRFFVRLRRRMRRRTAI